MARCEATKTIDTTDWISTLQKGSDVYPDMQIYQPAGLIILRTVALHGGMWVKDLTLKLHRSNLFYVTVYVLCVIGNRGMWACIISENNN